MTIDTSSPAVITVSKASKSSKSSKNNKTNKSTYCCALCNFESQIASKLSRHEKSDKHKLNMAKQKIAALEQEVSQLKQIIKQSTAAPDT